MTTQSPDATEQVDDRFRKPAPMIDLTPDAIGQLQALLDKAQQFASLNGLPWRSGASKGKPLLYGGEKGRGALIAYGTIGSWNEIDLAVAAVNALPALLAALPSNATTNEADADSGMSGDAVADAEWLWANLPTGNKPWTSLHTHEKALVCHTLARFRSNATTNASLVEAAYREGWQNGYASGDAGCRPSEQEHDWQGSYAATLRASNPDEVASVARCLEIAREVRDSFLSEEYAVGQPLASFNERFACDYLIAAIEREFASNPDEEGK